MTDCLQCVAQDKPSLVVLSVEVELTFSNSLVRFRKLLHKRHLR